MDTLDDDECSRACECAATTSLIVGLHLAATPVFLAMALLAGIGGLGAMGMPPAMHGGGGGWRGMTVMYLLMGVFHATPWLQRLGRQRSPRKPKVAFVPIQHAAPAMTRSVRMDQ